MSMTVKATWQDSVFKPKEPVNLPEYTEVDVVLPSLTAGADADDPTGWKAAEEFIGCIKTAPVGEPIAEEHDKYLHK